MKGTLLVGDVSSEAAGWQLTGDNLARVLADPGRVHEMPVQGIPALLGALAQLNAVLWTRLLSCPATESSAGSRPFEERLLTVRDVAQRLGARDGRSRHEAEGRHDDTRNGGNRGGWHRDCAERYPHGEGG